MPTILGANTLSTGYDVANSLRFNYDSSDYLNKTLGTATNRKIFTISMWVKRSELYGVNSETKYLMSAGNNASTNIDEFYFRHDTLDFSGYESSTTEFQLRTNQLFRDVSSWYHVVVAYDSTQGTASNRIKMYVNGSQITSFSTETYPDQNHEPLFNSNIAHEIGRNTDARKFDGYMTEVVFIDGQALDPTSFGEFDSDSPTIWKPIDVSGLTFGNNGFYLDFEDSGSLGNDKAGSNNFTVNNLTAADQSTDTCTNNYATLNILLPLHSSTFSEGNLKWTPSTAGQYYWANSTFGVSQGKWYMEAKLTTAASHNVIGIANDQAEDNTSFLSGSGGEGDGNIAYQYGYKSSNGQSYNNASGSSYGDTYTTNDIIGLYVDLDNNKIYWAKNGTLQNSGTGVSITDPGSIPGGVYFLAVADGTSSNSAVWEVNFGGTNTYSISSGNSDDNGYGNFEYSPNITGDGSAKSFYALNSKNLAEFG